MCKINHFVHPNDKASIWTNCEQDNCCQFCRKPCACDTVMSRVVELLQSICSVPLHTVVTSWCSVFTLLPQSAACNHPSISPTITGCHKGHRQGCLGARLSYYSCLHAQYYPQYLPNTGVPTSDLIPLRSAVSVLVEWWYRLEMNKKMVSQQEISKHLQSIKCVVLLSSCVVELGIFLLNRCMNQTVTVYLEGKVWLKVIHAEETLNVCWVKQTKTEILFWHSPLWQITGSLLVAFSQIFKYTCT